MRAARPSVLCQAGAVTPSAQLRRAGAGDADAMAALWLRSFAAALPSVRRAHSDAEVRAWVRHVLVAQRESWVSCADGALSGLLVLHGAEVDQLYVDPVRRGRGIGTLLLEHATLRRPAGLALWTFQVNTAARRFYARHGFVETLYTDGRGNEEGEPDVRMEWRPG